MNYKKYENLTKIKITFIDYGYDGVFTFFR